MSNADDAWIVSTEQRERFPLLFVLDYMVAEKQSYKVWPEREDYDLKPILDGLYARGWLEIESDRYFPSQSGWTIIQLLKKRYKEYVYYFDVYSAIDLVTGEFAFESYDQFEVDSDWLRFLDDERFYDLRIAVMEYLDMDAVEVVMMQFITETKYGRDPSRWKSACLSGQLFDDILLICNDAIDVSELSYRSDDGILVSGESVIEDILQQGTQLLGALLQRANHAKMGISLSGNLGNQPPLPVKLPPSNYFSFEVYSNPENG